MAETRSKKAVCIPHIAYIFSMHPLYPVTFQEPLIAGSGEGYQSTAIRGARPYENQYDGEGEGKLAVYPEPGWIALGYTWWAISCWGGALPPLALSLILHHCATHRRRLWM